MSSSARQRGNPGPLGAGLRATALWLLAALALVLCLRVEGVDHRGGQFLGWDAAAISAWESAPGPTPNQTTLTSPPLSASIAWTEAVPSWNIETPSGTGVKLELRRLDPAPATPFYILGYWASDPAGQPRESVPGQRDEHGEVQTDTLLLAKPAHVAQFRLTLTSNAAGEKPSVKFVGLSLLDRRVQREVLPPNRQAWGRELAVPERTQVVFPEGISAWCSPTALSMLLAYWGKQTGRPDLEIAVPVVASAVNDPKWPGTGNWPFNTAFAGSFAGMRAYVARLSDVSELEDWIAAGVPVAVSVSYNLLRGKPRDRADGHLVVVRGFTTDGDVVVNDPGTGKEIRRVFSRQNLARAWGVSRNTVYLVHPLSKAPPQDRFGHWWTPVATAAASR